MPQSSSSSFRPDSAGWRPAPRLIIALVAALLILIPAVRYRNLLSLDTLAAHEQQLRQFQTSHPILVPAAAFGIYTVVTALSVPGATAMTLVAGWYFGFAQAVVLVSFASTLGATLAFLLSRFVLRDQVQARFGDRLKTFHDALDRDGPWYLFTLRLIPVVPFFVINVVMGLTRIRTWTFWWVSQVGMLAGTMVYVYAGSTIPGLAELADPFRLRPADIQNWPALISAVSRHSAADSPGHALRHHLDSGTVELVDHLAETGSRPDPEQTETLLKAFNAAIVRPELTLQPPWSLIGTPRGQTESGSAASRIVTEINRRILVAVFPDIIRPPQPILSRRMMAAFLLLGLFPLAVRRLLGSARRTAAAADSIAASPASELPE